MKKKSKHGTFSLGQKVISIKGKEKVYGEVTSLFDNALIEINGHLCFIDNCKSA